MAHFHQLHQEEESIRWSREGLCPETKQLLSSTSKKKGKGGSKGGPANEEEPKTDSQPVSIHLHFKRYVFDPHKKMVQSWHLLRALQPNPVSQCFRQAEGSFRGLVEGIVASISGVWRLSYISFFLWGWSLLKCNDCGMLKACGTMIVLSPFMEMNLIQFALSRGSCSLSLKKSMLLFPFYESESIILTCSKLSCSMFLIQLSIIGVNTLASVIEILNL